jgi:hypothetical protein
MSSSAKYLNEVTEATDVQDTDYVVGYRTAEAGGMRRWMRSLFVGASGGVVGRPLLTGYTGGTATDIHSVATVGLAVGTVILAPNMPPSERQWQVIADPVPEDIASGIIRPTDYHATTNAKGLQLF